MEKRRPSTPSDVPAEQVRERTELVENKFNEVRCLKICKQSVFDREKKRLALEVQLSQTGEQLQQLGAAAARSDRPGVGSGGEAKGGTAVSDGLEARGATVRLSSVAEAEDQHH